MGHTGWRTETYITNWGQFKDIIRAKGCRLLKRLDEFPNSVLVTGCQRSGTTMLTRIITQSEGMVNYWFGPDDELDAALILSGYVDHHPQGRYCFQTTYINKCYAEYYDHSNGHKILWILRNPLSVVYSLLYNWSDEALDRLFGFCGASSLTGIETHLYRVVGLRGTSKLRRACAVYNGKVAQVFDLKQGLDPNQIVILDYDDLVRRKETILPAIYNFIDLKYKEEYALKIHAHSLSKVKRLSKRETTVVKSLCDPTYQRARTLLSQF